MNEPCRLAFVLSFCLPLLWAPVTSWAWGTSGSGASTAEHRVAPGNYSGLPDRKITPGTVNVDMTEALLLASCHTKGWTKLYRPPVSYTNGLKRIQMKQYGYSSTDPRDYEEDHLVPLCLGGASQDPKNLWPQPRGIEWSAEKKDKLEAQLCRLVCNGKVPLREGQQAFAVDWIAAYGKYVESGRYGGYRRTKDETAE